MGNNSQQGHFSVSRGTENIFPHMACLFLLTRFIIYVSKSLLVTSFARLSPPPSLQGCFPAHYSMDMSGQGRLSCLDSNHTHFLLVDDGTHGRYGVEIELRSRLEKCISRKHVENTGKKKF